MFPGGSSRHPSAAEPVSEVAEEAVDRSRLDQVHRGRLGGLADHHLTRGRAYDPARDFELTFRMRVFSVTGPFGLDFEVSDATTDYEFGFMENGVYLPPPGRPFLPLAPTTDGFHNYRVIGNSAARTYQLVIDGELVFEGGPVMGGDPAVRFMFGDGTFDADAQVDFDSVSFCQPEAVVNVRVDVKPDDPTNSVNPRSRGVVPVAIFGSATLSARSIDVGSITVAGAPVQKKPSGQFNASFTDVDGDGIIDLLVHVGTQDLHVERYGTEIIVRGRTTSGELIRGSDTIRVVP